MNFYNGKTKKIVAMPSTGWKILNLLQGEQGNELWWDGTYLSKMLSLYLRSKLISQSCLWHVIHLLFIMVWWTLYPCIPRKGAVPKDSLLIPMIEKSKQSQPCGEEWGWYADCWMAYFFSRGHCISASKREINQSKNKWKTPSITAEHLSRDCI